MIEKFDNFFDYAVQDEIMAQSAHIKINLFDNQVLMTGLDSDQNTEAIIMADVETVNEPVIIEYEDSDVDGDCEALENDLIAMNNEEKDAVKIIIARSLISEGKFSVEISDYGIVRDLLPTQEMAIECAGFISKREGIDIIENQAEKDDKFEAWFHDNAHRMEFHCIAPFCSYCNKDVTHEAYYIGITDAGIPFEFCKKCRDMLQRRKASETSEIERIGA